MNAYARLGKVELTQPFSREEAAELLNDIALSIVEAGDISDPNAQRLREAVENAVKDFLEGEKK